MWSRIWDMVRWIISDPLTLLVVKLAWGFKGHYAYILILARASTEAKRWEIMLSLPWDSERLLDYLIQLRIQREEGHPHPWIDRFCNHTRYDITSKMANSLCRWACKMPSIDKIALNLLAPSAGRCDNWALVFIAIGRFTADMLPFSEYVGPNVISISGFT